MNKNEKFVITINRELGSGGRTVGRLVAERLGVPFYDKALIRALEEKYELTTEEIERLKSRKRSWWADFKRVMVVGEDAANLTNYHVGSEADLLTTEALFKAEKEILMGIAEEESCVIAGRSAFFVLSAHPNRLSVLIQASMESRIERVMKKQNLSWKDAMKVINKVDKMREEYVKNYAQTSRYDTRNYDLVINMDGKTEEQAANLILSFID
jgi:cytidylate kinase